MEVFNVPVNAVFASDMSTVAFKHPDFFTIVELLPAAKAFLPGRVDGSLSCPSNWIGLDEAMVDPCEGEVGIEGHVSNSSN